LREAELDTVGCSYSTVAPKCLLAVLLFEVLVPTVKRWEVSLGKEEAGRKRTFSHLFFFLSKLIAFIFTK